MMAKYKTLKRKKHGKLSVGMVRAEGRRNVICKGFYKHSEEKNIYALWQFISAKTKKPYGKSTCFLEKI